MKRILVLATALICTWSASLLLKAGDWPGWRGPQRTDVSTESGLLKSWGDKGPTQLWSYDNAGLGYGGPAIVGKQMFLLGTRKESEVLIAIDVANGKERWATPIGSILNNGWGNGPRSTPAVDGNLVYASFDSAGVVACDYAGKVVWQRDLGKLTHVFGPASTPVLYKHLLIIHRGPGEPTHIIALDKRTGKTVWDTPEKGINDKLYGSWSTPVIYRTGDHDEFALSLPGTLKGYDPLTGKGGDCIAQCFDLTAACGQETGLEQRPADHGIYYAACQITRPADPARGIGSVTCDAVHEFAGDALLRLEDGRHEESEAEQAQHDTAELHRQDAGCRFLRAATALASAAAAGAIVAGELIGRKGERKVADAAARMAEALAPAFGVRTVVFDIEEGRSEPEQGVGGQADDHEPQDRVSGRVILDRQENTVRSFGNSVGTGQRDQAENRIQDGAAEIAHAHQPAEFLRFIDHYCLPVNVVWHANGRER